MRVLTFDVEDWFHILDEKTTKHEKDWVKYASRIDASMDRIFQLLDRNNQKATFFCLGWIAQQCPHIIRKIDQLGYEIGSHSFAHQLIYEQSREEFTQDLDRSIKTLEDVVGKKVRLYRAPGFSLKEGMEWVFEQLLEQGIEIDCSIFPAVRGHGGYPSFGAAEPAILNVKGVQLKEFPINVTDFLGKKLVFSGGGYFRLFPLGYVSRLTRRSSYVMTYFHPRDFDPGQPVIGNLSVTRRFKSYYGLRGALSKLECLIQKYRFIDVAEADREYDWSNARTLTVSDNLNRPGFIGG